MNGWSRSSLLSVRCSMNTSRDNLQSSWALLSWQPVINKVFSTTNSRAQTHRHRYDQAPKKIWAHRESPCHSTPHYWFNLDHDKCGCINQKPFSREWKEFSLPGGFCECEQSTRVRMIDFRWRCGPPLTRCRNSKSCHPSNLLCKTTFLAISVVTRHDKGIPARFVPGRYGLSV